MGHIPRGFLGATGALEEVELVVVLVESGLLGQGTTRR